MPNYIYTLVVNAPDKDTAQAVINTGAFEAPDDVTITTGYLGCDETKVTVPQAATDEQLKAAVGQLTGQPAFDNRKAQPKTMRELLGGNTNAVQ